MYYGSSSLLSLGDFFSSTVGSVVTGVAIVVIGALISFYTKALWKFVLLSGVISLVTTVAMFALLTTIHPTQFASSFPPLRGYTTPIMRSSLTPRGTASPSYLTLFSPLSLGSPSYGTSIHGTTSPLPGRVR